MKRELKVKSPRSEAVKRTAKAVPPKSLVQFFRESR